jgi:hypothetical protein
MIDNLGITIIELINNAIRNTSARPLILGGTSGSGGGGGGPTGGFVGYLPQIRVAYDYSELAASGLPVSGWSLLDNLNHIRYGLENITFLDLIDTPSSYADQAGKAVIVSDEEDGLEFGSAGHNIVYSSTPMPFRSNLRFIGSVTVIDSEPSDSTIVDISVSGGGGAGNFIDLFDVPGTYVGAAGKVVAVRTEENGLEFTTASGGGVSTFLELTDTPITYFGQNNVLVKVNDAADALEFVTGAEIRVGEGDDRSLFLGNHSGFSITVGYDNVAMGYHSLYFNTEGYQNTALGINALYSNDYGTDNVAVGFAALYSNGEGSSNVAIGANALYTNTYGEDNVAIGYGTLYENITGYNNIAIGYGALWYNTIGHENVAIGVSALYKNTEGVYNTAIGRGVLQTNTLGEYNSAMGASALQFNTIGGYSVAIGVSALQYNTVGYDNCALGVNALRSNTTGYKNAAIGLGAIYYNTTGHNNVAIGEKALYTLKPTSKAITAFANSSVEPGVKTKVTSSSHGRTDGQTVQITGTINYNGSWVISNKTTSTFDITIVFVATETGWWNLPDEGLYNTAIGERAGYSLVTGSSNVFLGYNAGYYETGSNKLYIANSNTTTPLIQGDFSTGILTVYKSLIGNEAGDVDGDFRWETDTYDGIFLDASNNSIVLMSNVAGKVGFFGVNAVIQQIALTSQLTTISGTAPGLYDYDIQDLITTSGYGFVTADEGQTTLKVIQNLQTRVSELETKLKAYGLLA